MNTLRLFFIPVFLFVSALSFAQTADSISLKTEYQPNKSYFNKIVFNSIVKTSLSGTEEYLQRMKDDGFSIFNEEKIKDSIEFTLVTSSRENDTIPVIIIIHKMFLSRELPENTKILGKYDGIHPPVFYDVIFSDNSQINENDKKSIIQYFQNIFKQCDAPRKNVKIGDEFSRNYEMMNNVFDIPDIPATTNVTDKYILKKIDVNFAYFNYIQTSSYSGNDDGSKISGIDQTTGTLVFDIKNNVTHQTQLKSTSNLELKTDGWGTVSVESKIDQQHTISVE